MYEILKHTHLIALALAFVLFVVRGILMMTQSPTGKHRFFLIAPHIINLVLIVSGICLAITLHLNPANQPWLMIKLIALIIFIGFSMAAFKHPKLHARKIFWFLALMVFLFIISVATSKNPLGVFAGLF